MSQDFTEDAMGLTHQPTEQIGRELADRIAARFRQDDPLIAAIDQARYWLRHGAPGRALEVLDAARERVK